MVGINSTGLERGGQHVACRAGKQGDVAARSADCRYVIVAAAIGAVVLLIAAGLAWTAYLVHVGNLDAMELAGKVAMPDPVSALDWPELHVRAIVPQPGEQPLVLLLVDWPAHPQRAATLLVALYGDERSVPLLSQWCATQASVSPTRQGGVDLELRRRQKPGAGTRGTARGGPYLVRIPSARGKLSLSHR